MKNRKPRTKEQNPFLKERNVGILMVIQMMVIQ